MRSNPQPPSRSYGSFGGSDVSLGFARPKLKVEDSHEVFVLLDRSSKFIFIFSLKYKRLFLWKEKKNIQVLPGLEPGSKDSESLVITITLQDHARPLGGALFQVAPCASMFRTGKTKVIHSRFVRVILAQGPC